MKSIIRFLFPIIVLMMTGYYVSSSLSQSGEGMAQKAIRDGIASQVRYHQGSIKDGEGCADFKTRIGTVASVKSTAESTPQLIALSNEARAANCLK